MICYVLVATSFSCLKNQEVMSFSVLTETKCSSLAKTELGNQKDQLSNGTLNAWAELENQQGSHSNGVSKHVIPPPSNTAQTAATMVAASNNEIPQVQAPPQNEEPMT